ncbi:MAG: hypothetical protein ACFFCS_06055 [Candidatus Hodarchaeota archaeon]
MKSRINIKSFNIILLVTVVVALILGLTYDFNHVLKERPLNEIRIIAPGVSNLYEITMTILDVMAAIIFLFMAYKYNAIRKKKSDKYLSSLIFYSAIYLGISWFLELLPLDIDSDISLIRDILGKYYMPLSIFSGLFLSYVAYEVFIEPTMPKDKIDPLSFFTIPSAIIGMFVGVCIVFFVYTPNLSPFEIIVATIGFAVFGILIIINILTVGRISRIKRNVEVEARQPLNSISIQLLLIIPIIFLTVLVEMGSVTNLPRILNQFFMITRAICCIIVAVLYHYSFINPSK